MLDMSVRSELLGLMRRLRMENGIAYLYISHDLNTVRAFCDRLVVLHEGRMVDYGRTEHLLHNPGHHYTAALVRLLSVGKSKEGSDA